MVSLSQPPCGTVYNYCVPVSSNEFSALGKTSCEAANVESGALQIDFEDRCERSGLEKNSRPAIASVIAVERSEYIRAFKT